MSEADSPLSKSGESCVLVFSGLNVHNEWKERGWAPRKGCEGES